MTSNLNKRVFSGIILVPSILFFVTQGGIWFDCFCILLTIALMLEWVMLWWKHFSTHKIKLSKAVLIIIGFIYISVALYKYWSLKNVPYKPLITFLIVWSTDVGAYIFGKLFGKTPLAPSISPNKTWEGFWGGIGVCVVFCSVASYVQLALLLPSPSFSSFIFNFFNDITLFSMFVFTVRFMFYSIAAHLGDLLESLVKRYLSVKDSSQLIPGHGGFLDRFDSFLAVCLSYYLKDLLHYYGVFF